MLRSIMAAAAALLLVACETGDAAPGNDMANESAESADRGLQPGLYEVVGFESLPGVGMSPETRGTQCIDPAKAAHPDRFLANPGNGCRAGELVISAHDLSREFRCNDGRVINFTATFDSDSWDQSIIGTSTQGGYEAHWKGQRVGDC